MAQVCGEKRAREPEKQNKYPARLPVVNCVFAMLPAICRDRQVVAKYWFISVGVR